LLVIGIDPGAMNTGLAWAEGEKHPVRAYVETITCTSFFPSRYVLFREKLERFLTSVPETPAAIAVEEPLVQGTRKTDEDGHRSILHLNGIYAIVVSEATRIWPKAHLFSWPPGLWRAASYDKKIVTSRMAKKYNLRFTSDDESDALGIADRAWILMTQKRGLEAELYLNRTQDPQEDRK